MVMVIAECGVNHNGDEATAYKLIDAAVEAGADVCKFQLFKPEGNREPYKWLCLPLDAYPRINSYCKERGIGFACTAFDAESLGWLLKNTDMAFVKISSGQDIATLDKPIAGGKFYVNDFSWKADFSNLVVIQSLALENRAPKNRVIRERLHHWQYLHVIPEYPTIPEHAHLKCMVDDRLDGLSDHSGDIFMPLAAVALGAKIIECHITLDKNQEGPDHKSSLTPQQFKEMVRGIHAIEKGLA